MSVMYWSAGSTKIDWCWCQRKINEGNAGGTVSVSYRCFNKLPQVEFKTRNTVSHSSGWHHWLKRHESEQTPGGSEGQGSLESCSHWGCNESDTTEQQHFCWSEVQHYYHWTEIGVSRANSRQKIWENSLLTSSSFWWLPAFFGLCLYYSNLHPWWHYLLLLCLYKSSLLLLSSTDMWNGIFPATSINKDVTAILWIFEPRGSPRGRTILAI